MAFNKQTSGRLWGTRDPLAYGVHVKPIETNTRKVAEIATAAHAANKTGKTSGILGKLFGGIFGGGGGGVGGFFSNIFSSGQKMTGFGSILGAVGSFLGGLDDTQDKLLARKIDVEEKLGMEQLRINEMKAKDAIRQTGLSSMYMGWTPKQADVPGIFEGTPGLVVGDAPTEVASNTGGIIGGGAQGIITEAQQRVVG
jgi:hypothetical protein